VAKDVYDESVRDKTTMLDTTPVAITIRHLISTGTPERELLAAVARHYPELTSAELSAALQEATTAAERHAVEVARRH
jgi:hypothetical protein